MPGFILRPYAGDDPHEIADAINASLAADGIDDATDPVELEKYFEGSEKFEPRRDVAIAELDGSMVGCGIATWNEDPNGNRFYFVEVYAAPVDGRPELFDRLVAWCEKRLREMSSCHEYEGRRFFRVMVSEGSKALESVVLRHGYAVMRTGYHLVRPNLDGLPDFPVLPGIEVRPVEEAHYPEITRAWNEAVKDMRWQPKMTLEDLEEWSKHSSFDPSLWCIAWEGDRVVGTTFGIINERKNRVFGRKRGYTEYISVARHLRGRGLAKALMAKCMSKLKERGMDSAELGVDSENPSGARHLYEGMGFCIVSTVIHYWKPLEG